MGTFQELKSTDGHTFQAYVAKPIGEAHAALVVLQEIFGVNSHIREVADSYAKEGYLVIAPATFSRLETNVELGYSDQDISTGFALKQAVSALPSDPLMLDIQAAIDFAKESGKKVGIFGYCWGGLLAWRSAAELNGIDAAVTYYGGGMPQEAHLKPSCPVLSHFGELDTHIPLDSVKAFEKAHPEVEVHIYPAQHGFNCDQRGSYDAPSAQLARARTLDFFKKHLA